MPWHVIGLDLGCQADYSALSAVEASDAAEPRYAVTHLHRWPLGTRYTQVVDDARRLCATPPLSSPALVVDGTGVGAAVCDLFSQANLPGRVIPVVITAGSRATADEAGRLMVPKRELVGVLQVLLQSRRLVVAKGLALAETLGRELANFRVKVTAAGNETMESWRERDHDDLVLSVALACWVAEQAARLAPARDDGDPVVYT